MNLTTNDPNGPHFLHTVRVLEPEPIEQRPINPIWQELEAFLTEGIELIQLQKKGYVDAMYKAAIARFGEDRMPAKSVFKSLIAFYRVFMHVDKIYCENKYYQPSPRKRRAATPPATEPDSTTAEE